MENLTPKQRHAVTLKARGMSRAESARPLGVTANAIRNRIHRARRAMRKIGVDIFPHETDRERRQPVLPMQLSICRQV